MVQKYEKRLKDGKLMVQKYEKRLKDGKYFNQFGIISREIGCLGTSPNS